MPEPEPEPPSSGCRSFSAALSASLIDQHQKGKSKGGEVDEKWMKPTKSWELTKEWWSHLDPIKTGQTRARRSGMARITSRGSYSFLNLTQYLQLWNAVNTASTETCPLLTSGMTSERGGRVSRRRHPRPYATSSRTKPIAVKARRPQTLSVATRHGENAFKDALAHAFTAPIHHSSLQP